VLTSEAAQVSRLAQQLGVETILASMQVIDSALGRMRYSTRGRTLAELALVRLCRLGNLEELSDMIAQLKMGGSAPSESPQPLARASNPPPRVASASDEAKKKELDSSNSERLSASASATASRPAAPTPPALSLAPSSLSVEQASQVWQQVLAQQSDMTREMASTAASVAISAPNQLVVQFTAQYNSCKSYCERPEQVARFEQSLEAITGQRLRISFVLLPAQQSADETKVAPSSRPASGHQRMLAKAEHPLVRRAVELFDARPVRLEEPGPVGSR
jgi:DNA polymerase-3 subunit gamma/tau